ncbi:MAG TPA: NACHT domain-containing protein, partial [Allocoleopsis sp.]
MTLDFSGYLRSVCHHYEQWWECYTLTDAVGKERVSRKGEPLASPFDFGLMVQTVGEKTERREEENRRAGEQEKEKIERLPVLEGIRKYAAQHVLLRGRPGSGKSTALIRLLLEDAEAATQSVDSRSPIPILVELRYWSESVIDRIQSFIHQHDPTLDLDRSALNTLLRQGRFLLLIDGLNELPSEAARQDVIRFRKDYPQTAMIFTTRELSTGGDFGIAKQLEMQPLTEIQMRQFVQAYLPQDQAEQLLRQLKDRLRELGQTPLLLWMLCSLFQQTGTIPPNLGMVFRCFTQGYERNVKQDVPIQSDRRHWARVLQRLAFIMLQGEDPSEKPTEFLVAIDRSQAERALVEVYTNEVPYPHGFVQNVLEDLLNHHLIQLNSDKIEFRHQLLQEYYAAEALL